MTILRDRRGLRRLRGSRVSGRQLSGRYFVCTQKYSLRGMPLIWCQDLQTTPHQALRCSVIDYNFRKESWFNFGNLHKIIWVVIFTLIVCLRLINILKHLIISMIFLPFLLLVLLRKSGIILFLEDCQSRIKLQKENSYLTCSCRAICSFLRIAFSFSSRSAARSGYFSTLVLFRRLIMAFSRAGTRTRLTFHY